jgi:hypothetical protein
MKRRTEKTTEEAGEFEEILDEEQQEIAGGTGQEVVLWPWDLE